MEKSVAEEGEEREEESEETEEPCDKNDPSFKPHIQTQPTHMQLNIPVKELREEACKIGNRRNLTNRGQSDILSTMVLKGGGDLKDFPCSPSTMRT